MADSKKPKLSEKPSFKDLCIVYVLYFDEARGHVPLIIYPIDIDNLKENKRFMRPIRYHPIWFMPVEEQEALDHIDLEFKNFTFFGKKFLVKSKRKKRRAGLEEETPETIVIIVSLPNNIEIFGDELIKSLTVKIQDNFKDKLFEIIEYDIAKEQVIKTAEVKKTIENGAKIINKLRDLISQTVEDYFSNVIKQSDVTSIKQQKALSYLALKGIDVSRLGSAIGNATFSAIKIFDPKKTAEVSLSLKLQFMVSSINIIEDSQELEILVQNNTDEEFNNLTVNITHVKEFFEKEIMNQIIEFWFPHEELLFISPIFPHIDEYLFFIIKENKNVLLSQKIDINLLNKIKS